jgi:hypothetical protein
MNIHMNKNKGAKLLYGEITALCSLKGFCRARNACFASLYEKDGRTVNRWLKTLKDGGYVTISFTFKPGSKEVDERIIRLTAPKTKPPGRDGGPPPPEDNGDNGENAAPDGPEQGGENTAVDGPKAANGPPGESGGPEVVTFLSGGGDTGVTTCGQNCQGVVTKMSGRIVQALLLQKLIL